MKYIFLTNTIGGYSGGTTYIHNKLLYLKNKGWEVLVFDCTGFANLPISIEELKIYDKNRIQDLFFNPYWLRNAKREKVISHIIRVIGSDEQIVIESNTVAMSLWGELIASRLGAKHLVYLLSEKLSVTDKTLYDFYKYKSTRFELFSISHIAYQNLMCKFENVSDADLHYWAARIQVPIEDVECKELNNLNKATYNIGHFGRKKGYFLYMFQQIAHFADHHQDETVNFILLGVDNVDKSLTAELPANVCLCLIPSQQPIPKSFFDKTDVVIGTAGCANLSFRYGAKVISMDINNMKPLGVLGFDTTDRNIRSENNHYDLSLSETLENLLTNKKYEGNSILEIPSSPKGHDYHLTFVTHPDGKYYDVSHIVMPMRTKYARIIKILLYFNLVRFCSEIRYRIIKNK